MDHAGCCVFLLCIINGSIWSFCIRLNEGVYFVSWEWSGGSGAFGCLVLGRLDFWIEMFMQIGTWEHLLPERERGPLPPQFCGEGRARKLWRKLPKE